MSDLSRGAFLGTLLGASQVAVASGTSRGVPGRTALEFIGTINQKGADMSMTGYLTAIAGVAEEQLFTDPTVRSKDTARLQLTATGKMTSRNVLTPLFVLDAESNTEVRFNANPSYGTGFVVAEATSDLQTVVHVVSPFTAQSPGKGLFSATGSFVWTWVDEFVVSGVAYRFGRGPQYMRLTMVGDATLTDPSGPISTINIAGSATLVEESTARH